VWVLVLAGLVIFRPDRALHVASGMTAHTLCSATFVSELDPDKTFTETVRPTASVAAPLLRYQVDRNAKSVDASVLGVFASKASFHPGYGCRLDFEDSIAVPPPLPEVARAPELATVETANADLRGALERAFAEQEGHAPRNVKAVVIVKDGRIVGERYAAGYGPETPLLSYSVAKSVTNALVGILVRQGKLNVEAPASVAAWRGAGDARAAITLDNLIRMTSGLALAESDSGFDPVSRMLFLESNMAAFAEAGQLRVKPGTEWVYTSANTLIVSDIVRRAIGGGQDAYLRFARAELFAPTGMRNVTMEFDGAGTQISSTRILAPARDWARFGMLFLNNGVAANGARVLPEGWVAYSRRSTLGSTYGAGFWTNDGPSEYAAGRIKGGMPADAFFASGNLGQRIYIVPSERLVVVRFGVTQRPPDFDIVGDVHLVRDAIAALKNDGGGAGIPL
jgi:CubicO group peptidase (beta-lactamase class C family)